MLKKLSKSINHKRKVKSEGTEPPVWSPPQQAVTNNLQDNMAYLQQELANCCDLVARPLKIGLENSADAFIIYLDDLVDSLALEKTLQLLMQGNQSTTNPLENPPIRPLHQVIYDHLLNVGQVKPLDDLNTLILEILTGTLGLVLDGEPVCFSISIKGGPKNRPINESPSEGTLRGPRDGFLEDIQVNRGLIRRRIKSPKLKFEKMTIGTLTQTQVNIVYIEGLALASLIQEMKQRLERIKIDGIIESGYIEEFIEDTPYSIFPQVIATERPDRVAVALLNGRVALLIDASPSALIVPASIIRMLEGADDNYVRFPFANFTRGLRLITLNFAMILPAFYVAISTFHQEMLPTKILISLAGVREGLPFPVLVEILFMETVFEFITEAGIRLPRAVGSAVSIVGALVIGDAAVNAGFVSPATVIVVGLTAISALTVPAVGASHAIGLIRFPLMLLAAAFGFLGIAIGLLFVLIHLCSLRSFGVPYLDPLAPLHLTDFKENLFRAPRWSLFKRPTEVSQNNPLRQPVMPKGKPPKGNEE
ncbi:MAG: spore germination protein [Desulfosporosinus sp.]